MKLSVDFSEVQSKATVPAGDYQCVIADCLLKEKVGSDHPYLNWDLVVAEGDYQDRHLFLTTSFKPEALWKMMETFQNLGITDKEFDLDVDDETGQLKEPAVIGLPCIAQVYNEEYKQRMTSKVSSILGPNGEGGTGAPEEAPAAAPAAAKTATKPAAASKPAAANGAKRSPFPTTGKRVFK